LTPQERFLYQHHLDNLSTAGRGGGVIHPNGDISTVYQAVVAGPKGRFYNIPTVWHGTIVPVRTAMDFADRVGMENWPSYPTPELADQRYMQMHDFMARDVDKYLQNPPQRGNARGR